MTLGSRLRQARKAAKLTQPELADLSRVSQKTISKIERGDQDSSGSLVQLAQACGVRPEWLATGELPMVTAAQRQTMRVAEEHAEYKVDGDAAEIALAWSRL